MATLQANKIFTVVVSVISLVAGVFTVAKMDQSQQQALRVSYREQLVLAANELTSAERALENDAEIFNAASEDFGFGTENPHIVERATYARAELLTVLTDAHEHVGQYMDRSSGRYSLLVEHLDDLSVSQDDVDAGEELVERITAATNRYIESVQDLGESHETFVVARATAHFSAAEANLEQALESATAFAADAEGKVGNSDSLAQLREAIVAAQTSRSAIRPEGTTDIPHIVDATLTISALSGTLPISDVAEAISAEEERLARAEARRIAQATSSSGSTASIATSRSEDRSPIYCAPPSGDSGLQNWVAQVRTMIQQRFGVDRILGTRPGDPRDHGRGLALDVMVPIGGELGDAVANWSISNMRALNIKYVIWKQQIYGEWAHRWEFMPDRGNATANHYDHVHISFHPGSGSCI